MEKNVVISRDPLITKPITEIQIPDLWRLAHTHTNSNCNIILEVWQLCHSLRDHILNS